MSVLQLHLTTPPTARGRKALWALALPVMAALAACDGEPFDYDLRGVIGDNSFDTAEAALNATNSRPTPDERGIISYATYQVAVARSGDTVSTMAARIGADAGSLARFNGVQPDDPLRAGEVIALPERVPTGVPVESTASSGGVDVNAVATTALASTAVVPETTLPAPTPATEPATRPAERPASVVAGTEPVRHKVERGETAFSIARLYDVSVRSLAEWNGLDSEFTVQAGRYLLIPTRAGAAPETAGPTTAPGTGTPTPLPPSASAPLPTEVPLAAATPVAIPESAALETTAAPSDTRMLFPVEGDIIREFSPGRRDGIDIAAPAGTAVRAADVGDVAAVTQDADGVPFIVIKHADNVFSVYGNVANASVSRGDRISRGQNIATVREGDPSFVHFQVREGLESTDPMPYLR
ncbi:MAG: LysM peptidoglycan-binding domain-containing protein [Pseudomonadota bacterium]